VPGAWLSTGPEVISFNQFMALLSARNRWNGLALQHVWSFGAGDDSARLKSQLEAWRWISPCDWMCWRCVPRSCLSAPFCSGHF